MIEQIKIAIKSDKVIWRKHVLSRLFERGIKREEILEVIIRGEVIEEYTEDLPYPSMLFFKMVKGRPLHVVISYDELNKFVYIITAYEPSLDFFEDDFKTRIIK